MQMMSDSVLVLMPTYNHGKYIAKAIESVLSQKRSFNICLRISDDASIDNTFQIASTFSSTSDITIQLTRNDTNIGAFANGAKLRREAVKSGFQYIAILEGDDYWTDEFKLQKQFDFLQQSSDYSLCGHLSYAVDENGNRVSDHFVGNFPGATFTNADFSVGYKKIPSASFFFRNLPCFADPFIESVYGADRAILYLMSRAGKIKVLNFVGSAYRVHPQSLESNFRVDGKKLAHRNVEENLVYLRVVDPEFKRGIARKIRWNYFYLTLASLRDFELISAISFLQKLFRFQLVVMGFHSVIPKK